MRQIYGDYLGLRVSRTQGTESIDGALQRKLPFCVRPGWYAIAGPLIETSPVPPIQEMPKSYTASQAPLLRTLLLLYLSSAHLEGQSKEVSSINVLVRKVRNGPSDLDHGFGDTFHVGKRDVGRSELHIRPSSRKTDKEPFETWKIREQVGDLTFCAQRSDFKDMHGWSEALANTFTK